MKLHQHLHPLGAGHRLMVSPEVITAAATFVMYFTGQVWQPFGGEQKSGTERLCVNGDEYYG